MNLGTILSNYSYFFILIMVRYVGIFLITPVLGSEIILTRIKVGLSFLLAIVTVPVLYQQQTVAIPTSVITIALEVIRELAIGFLLGFVVFLVFAAIQLAGQLIDLRMGFRIANVFDPISGASSPIIGQLKKH
jgi:flagellar biosynthetic protein FliR